MNDPEITKLTDSIIEVANTIATTGAVAGEDKLGKPVGCLVEAGMSISAGLHEIAAAIDGLSKTVDEHYMAQR